MIMNTTNITLVYQKWTEDSYFKVETGQVTHNIYIERVNLFSMKRSQWTLYSPKGLFLKWTVKPRELFWNSFRKLQGITDKSPVIVDFENLIVAFSVVLVFIILL